MVVDEVPPSGLSTLVEKRAGRAVVDLSEASGERGTCAFRPEEIKGLEREMIVTTGFAEAVRKVQTQAKEHATTGDDTPLRSTTDALIPGLASTVSPPSLITDIVTAPARIRTVSPEYPQVARAA